MEEQVLDQVIKRINELYHKSKSEGLTEEEAQEQAMLRQTYLAEIRGSVRTQMSYVDIQEPDGSITNLGEQHGDKKGN